MQTAFYEGNDECIVQVIDGVSLLWKDGPTSWGKTRLEDLPDELRRAYGYDPAKTAAAAALERETKAREQQARVQAAQVAQAQAQEGAARAVSDASGASYSGYSPGSQGSYSRGGRVYVRSYTRSQRKDSASRIIALHRQLHAPKLS